MKKCAFCKQTKPSDFFYKHRTNKDGLTGRCRKCIHIQVLAWRHRNRMKVRALDRKYASSEKAKKRRKKYLKTEKGKETRNESTKNWLLKNKLKLSAQCKARYAVKTGKLKKQTCAICGRKEVEGHHEDYSKPLEVTWLCQSHHSERHRILRGESK